MANGAQQRDDDEPQQHHGPEQRVRSLCVPKRCVANSTMRITTAAGMTNGLSESVATLTPSRALSTEIAGVMTPSP